MRKLGAAEKISTVIIALRSNKVTWGSLQLLPSTTQTSTAGICLQGCTASSGCLCGPLLCGRLSHTCLSAGGRWFHPVMNEMEMQIRGRMKCVDVHVVWINVSSHALSWVCFFELEKEHCVCKYVHPLPLWTPRWYWVAWPPHHEGSASSQWRSVPQALQHTALSPSWIGSPSEMCIQSTRVEERLVYVFIIFCTCS